MLQGQTGHTALHPDMARGDLPAEDVAVAPVFAWSPARSVSQTRHPALTVALHWGTLLAIIIAVGAMFVRDALEDPGSRQVLLQLHRQLGLLVLIGTAVRIARRIWGGLVDHAANMAAVFRWSAKGAHLLLYALLVSLPLVGWACTSAHGISLALLGMLPLPKLVAPDSELADTLSDYHILLSWALLGLVAIHAGAALWHHYVRKDAVLSAMLPGWYRRRTLPAGARKPSRTEVRT